MVDFNQSLSGILSEKGYAWKYGTLGNPETLAHIGIANASIVVCTIADVFLKGASNLRFFAANKTSRSESGEYNAGRRQP